MSYLDDFEEKANNKKIPYDDIPISRNIGAGGRVSQKRNSYRPNKVLSVLIAVLIIMNLILSAISIYYIRHSKIKYINNYTLDLNTSGEVSSAVTSISVLSVVCVAAGRDGSTQTKFFKNTNSHGSGVILRVDRTLNAVYFMTCYHVINGHEDEVWLIMPMDINPIRVEVVGFTSEYDIAVLKYSVSADMDEFLNGARPVDLYDSTYLSLGEKVYAIGNPMSKGISVTDGIISKLNNEVTISGRTLREIQTSAAINPGNSGGGLFNENGKFVGIVNAKIHATNSGNESVSVDGIAYAIPSTIAVGIAGSIIRNNGKPSYIDLGATFSYDTSRGKYLDPVEYSGSIKQIERYYVKVESVVGGSISDGKLEEKKYISKIKFNMYDVNGNIVTKEVEMYNKDIFEDYSYSIVKDSTITFYYSVDSSGEEQKIVEVLASKTETLSS